MTLDELCRELKNYFKKSTYFGNFEIVDGKIQTLDEILKQGQYFRIVGSVFNDGIYQYPTSNLIDEEFEGAVLAMAVPKEVIALASEIDEWEKANEKSLNSPYQSESFGGYSYSLKNGGDSGGLTWQSHFKTKLNKWRKLSCLY